jgi:hypothetical protein
MNYVATDSAGKTHSVSAYDYSLKQGTATFYSRGGIFIGYCGPAVCSLPNVTSVKIAKEVPLTRGQMWMLALVGLGMILILFLVPPLVRMLIGF